MIKDILSDLTSTQGIGAPQIPSPPLPLEQNYKFAILFIAIIVLAIVNKIFLQKTDKNAY